MLRDTRNDWNTLLSDIRQALQKFPQRAGWGVHYAATKPHGSASGTTSPSAATESPLASPRLSPTACSRSPLRRPQQAWAGLGSSASPNSQRGTVLRIQGIPALATEGNFLEAINLCLNQCEQHHIDRDLARTGHQLMVVTAAPGVFEVDPWLNLMTKQRMMDNGIGCDLVSLCRPPLHVVPLFILPERSGATLTIVNDVDAESNRSRAGSYSSVGGRSRAGSREGRNETRDVEGQEAEKVDLTRRMSSTPQRSRSGSEGRRPTGGRVGAQTTVLPARFGCIVPHWIHATFFVNEKDETQLDTFLDEQGRPLQAGHSPGNQGGGLGTPDAATGTSSGGAAMASCDGGDSLLSWMSLDAAISQFSFPLTHTQANGASYGSPLRHNPLANSTFSPIAPAAAEHGLSPFVRSREDPYQSALSYAVSAAVAPEGQFRQLGASRSGRRGFQSLPSTRVFSLHNPRITPSGPTLPVALFTWLRMCGMLSFQVPDDVRAAAGIHRKLLGDNTAQKPLGRRHSLATPVLQDIACYSFDYGIRKRETDPPGSVAVSTPSDSELLLDVDPSMWPGGNAPDWVQQNLTADDSGNSANSSSHSSAASSTQLSAQQLLAVDYHTGAMAGGSSTAPGFYAVERGVPGLVDGYLKDVPTLQELFPWSHAVLSVFDSMMKHSNSKMMLAGTESASRSLNDLGSGSDGLNADITRCRRGQTTELEPASKQSNKVQVVKVQSTISQPLRALIAEHQAHKPVAPTHPTAASSRTGRQASERTVAARARSHSATDTSARPNRLPAAGTENEVEDIDPWELHDRNIFAPAPPAHLRQTKQSLLAVVPQPAIPSPQLGGQAAFAGDSATGGLPGTPGSTKWVKSKPTMSRGPVHSRRGLPQPSHPRTPVLSASTDIHASLSANSKQGSFGNLYAGMAPPAITTAASSTVSPAPEATDTAPPSTRATMPTHTEERSSSSETNTAAITPTNQNTLALASESPTMAVPSSSGGADDDVSPGTASVPIPVPIKPRSDRPPLTPAQHAQSLPVTRELPIAVAHPMAGGVAFGLAGSSKRSFAADTVPSRTTGTRPRRTGSSSDRVDHTWAQASSSYSSTSPHLRSPLRQTVKPGPTMEFSMLPAAASDGPKAPRERRARLQSDEGGDGNGSNAPSRVVGSAVLPASQSGSLYIRRPAGQGASIRADDTLSPLAREADTPIAGPLPMTPGMMGAGQSIGVKHRGPISKRRTISKSMSAQDFAHPAFITSAARFPSGYPAMSRTARRGSVTGIGSGLSGSLARRAVTAGKHAAELFPGATADSQQGPLVYIEPTPDVPATNGIMVRLTNQAVFFPLPDPTSRPFFNPSAEDYKLLEPLHVELACPIITPNQMGRRYLMGCALANFVNPFRIQRFIASGTISANRRRWAHLFSTPMVTHRRQQHLLAAEGADPNSSAQPAGTAAPHTLPSGEEQDASGSPPVHEAGPQAIPRANASGSVADVATPANPTAGKGRLDAEDQNDDEGVLGAFRPNWRTLSEPALLPLTTDYIPRIFDAEFHHTVYQLLLSVPQPTVDPLLAPSNDNDAPIMQDPAVVAASASYLMELVGQRLAQDYQMVVMNAENEKTLQQVKQYLSPGPTKRMVLSMGHRVHLLQYSPEQQSVNVTTFTRKQSWMNDASVAALSWDHFRSPSMQSTGGSDSASVADLLRRGQHYRYRMWCPYADRPRECLRVFRGTAFGSTDQSGLAESNEIGTVGEVGGEFNWNTMDSIVVKPKFNRDDAEQKADSEFQLSDSIRYKRAVLLLLPQQPDVTKGADWVYTDGGVYGTPRLTQGGFQTRTQRFLKFMEQFAGRLQGNDLEINIFGCTPAAVSPAPILPTKPMDFDSTYTRPERLSQIKFTTSTATARPGRPASRDDSYSIQFRRCRVTPVCAGDEPWVNVGLGSCYNPARAFPIYLQWIVASGSSVDEFVTGMQRRAKAANMSLVYVPSFTRSEAISDRIRNPPVVMQLPATVARPTERAWLPQTMANTLQYGCIPSSLGGPLAEPRIQLSVTAYQTPSFVAPVSLPLDCIRPPRIPVPVRMTDGTIITPRASPAASPALQGQSLGDAGSSPDGVDVAKRYAGMLLLAFEISLVKDFDFAADVARHPSAATYRRALIEASHADQSRLAMGASPEAQHAASLRAFAAAGPSSPQGKFGRWMPVRRAMLAGTQYVRDQMEDATIIKKSVLAMHTAPVDAAGGGGSAGDDERRGVSEEPADEDRFQLLVHEAATQETLSSAVAAPGLSAAPRHRSELKDSKAWFRQYVARDASSFVRIDGEGILWAHNNLLTGRLIAPSSQQSQLKQLSVHAAVLSETWSCLNDMVDQLAEAEQAI